MIRNAKRYRYASFKALIVQLFIRLFVPLFKRYINENKRSNFSMFLQTRRIPLELTLHSHSSIILVKSTFFVVVSSNCIPIHERRMFFTIIHIDFAVNVETRLRRLYYSAM